VDHSVAPAAYFIARINHESKSFLCQNCLFLDSSSFCFPWKVDSGSAQPEDDTSALSRGPILGEMIIPRGDKQA
jgi:hypothetical protein